MFCFYSGMFSDFIDVFFLSDYDLIEEDSKIIRDTL